jgi:hypothetical protein
MQISPQAEERLYLMRLFSTLSELGHIVKKCHSAYFATLCAMGHFVLTLSAQCRKQGFLQSCLQVAAELLRYGFILSLIYVHIL